MRRPAFLLRGALVLRGALLLRSLFVLCSLVVREVVVLQGASLPGVPDSRPAGQALLLHFFVHIALRVELCRAKLCRAKLCSAELRRAELRRPDLRRAPLRCTLLRRSKLCSPILLRLDVRLRLLDVVLQVLYVASWTGHVRGSRLPDHAALPLCVVLQLVGLRLVVP